MGWAGCCQCGVEVESRNRCIVRGEEAIGGQGPRVGAPRAGDINQEEGISQSPL